MPACTPDRGSNTPTFRPAGWDLAMLKGVTPATMPAPRPLAMLRRVTPLDPASVLALIRFLLLVCERQPVLVAVSICPLGVLRHSCRATCRRRTTAQTGAPAGRRVSRWGEEAPRRRQQQRGALAKLAAGWPAELAGAGPSLGRAAKDAGRDETGLTESLLPPMRPSGQTAATAARPGDQRPLRSAAKRSAGLGGAEGDRTPDLVNAIHALSQLSYGPLFTA